MPGFILRSALPSLSNSLLPFIESPYYYCHYKGLDLSIAKSEIPLFPPPREDLYGFFHHLTDSLSHCRLLFCSSLGMVCELGKEGFIFRFIPAAHAARTRITPPRAPCSPFLFLRSYSQHLWETRKKRKFELLRSRLSDCSSVPATKKLNHMDIKGDMRTSSHQGTSIKRCAALLTRR